MIFKQLKKLKRHNYLYTIDRFKKDFPQLEHTIAIFGAGGRGRDFKKFWESLGGTVSCFSDNNSSLWGAEFCGLPVVSPKELIRINIPIIVASFAMHAIGKQLHELECQNVKIYHEDPEVNAFRKITKKWLKENENDLNRVINLLEDEKSRQLYTVPLAYLLNNDCAYIAQEMIGTHYHHSQVHAQNGDTIINAGGFTGDTDIFYHSVAKNCTIHSFEPLEKLFAQLEDTVKKIHTGTSIPVKYGLWSTKGTTSFTEGVGGDSHITNVVDPDESSENININLTTIDDYCVENNIVPDLIKMDIEGAEPYALEGGKKTIIQHRPKLQISIYHSVEQRISIPLQINDMVPNYRYFIGHHSYGPGDTVLYATPK